MRDCSVPLALVPLLVASLALALREVRRVEPGQAPPPGEADVVPGPPALLLGAPTVGRWSVVLEQSTLLLTEHGREGRRACAAAELAGEVVIDAEGRMADLDIEALLDPGCARALLGPVGEGRLALRADSARSLPGTVPGTRSARPRGRLFLDGRPRSLTLRAVWMPCGPGLQRLQLEAAWRGGARGDDDVLKRLLEGSRRTTLALDLVLARS